MQGAADGGKKDQKRIKEAFVFQEYVSFVKVEIGG